MDDGGRFAIDATSGLVTVSGNINRETDGPMRTITVRATSVDGSYSEQTFTIAVTDVDEFDTSSPIDVDVAANSVAENSASGTVVGITALSVDATRLTIRSAMHCLTTQVVALQFIHKRVS